MLKHGFGIGGFVETSQPPSGGCVLKLLSEEDGAWTLNQPPSGGCVLKRA